MNRIHSLVCGVLLCLFGIAAHAQATTITAANLKLNRTAIASGQVLFTAVDSITGAPIGFADGSGNFNAPGAFTCAITSGALSGCVIPDASLTTPANIVYQIQIVNTTAGTTYTMPQAVAGISGSTWALDHYGPPANASQIQTLSLTVAPGAPSGACVSNRMYVNSSSNSLYTCVAGAWVLVAASAKLQPVVARTVLEGLNKAPSILTTTSQPTNMSTLSFAVKGTYLLSTQSNGGTSGVVGGLNVSDITDPANPVQVGLFTSSSGSNPTSLSIDATGTYAYVGYYDTDKLDVWNISQLPNAPALVGSSTLTLSTPISRSVISGNYLYVSSFRGGANTANVYVINIATPSTPSLTGTYTTATGYGAQWVRVSGTTMYISESSTGTGKIEAVSVATPSTPTLLSAVTLPHANQDLVLNGTHAYVGNHDSLNMEIIDISTPSAMVDNGAGSLASSIACAPLGADGGNNTLFFACDSPSSVAVVDVTNPTSPVPLPPITASSGSLQTVAAFGRFLFASHYTAFTVDAIDLGNEYNLSAGRMQVAGSNVCTAANGLCRLTGTTGSIGGSALTAGNCATGTASVAGSIVGRPVSVSRSDGALPGGSIRVDASVTATGTVSVEVCAVVASTPSAVTYNVATY